MQGRKDFTPKLFYELSLDCLVPQEDFYRKVNQHLELHFLYKATAPYYGREGQQSIDPVVFFKILLVGYLHNINSDRALLRYCADSLSIRLFLGYDLDEELPWHSTISRTRQLFGEEVFLSLFQKVLSLCVEKGMVRGKRQCVDSAYIKANASMDSLLEKEVVEDVKAYVNELEENSELTVSKDRAIFSEIMDQTLDNLSQNEIEIEEVLADVGYSSGESLQYCQDKNINAYIPNFGQYKPEREGFVFNKEENRYECIKEGGNKAFLPFKRIMTDSKG